MRDLVRLVDRHLEEVVCAVLLCVLMALLGLQVFLRFVFAMGFAWNEELIRFVFVWFVYLGAVLGVQRKGHIRIVSFLRLLPTGRPRQIALITSDVVWLAFNIAVVIIALPLLERFARFPQLSPVLRIDTWWIYLVVPVSFALMSARLVQLYIREGPPQDIPAEGPEAEPKP